MTIATIENSGDGRYGDANDGNRGGDDGGGRPVMKKQQ